MGSALPSDDRSKRVVRFTEILRACAVDFTPRIDWPQWVGKTTHSLVGDVVEIGVRRVAFGYSWNVQPHPIAIRATLGVSGTRAKTIEALREELPLVLGVLMGTQMACIPHLSDRPTREIAHERLGTASFLALKGGPAARWLAEEVAAIEMSTFKFVKAHGAARKAAHLPAATMGG
jgi:hypothetical protein